MGLALAAVLVMMREGGRSMKNFVFTVVFAVLAVGTLSACVKDDLSDIDIKVDGDVRTTFSTGSGGSGMMSRTRVGIDF
jgi:hypothetical protein